MVTLIIIIGCAVFYYRLGEHEYDSGWLTCGISIILSLAGFGALGWGWIGNLLLQAGLFVGLSIWNLTTRKHIG